MNCNKSKETIPIIRPLIKTPISYYGGKQLMLPQILPRIPTHRIYTEPFFGGGAVFFAKKPSSVEVINDTNREAINFYKVLKTNYSELYKLIETTLHSRSLHDDAQFVYDKPHLFSDVYRAWAFWVNSSQGFGTALNSGWGYSNCDKAAKTIQNKKTRFTEELAMRLENTQIECNDALKVIQSRDTEDTFHYIDPPYIEVHQGHYSGYLRADFEQLLKLLANVKGKFLLSTYPTDILTEYTIANGWYFVRIDKPLGVAKAKGTNRKRKVEVLTANYLI